MTDVTWHLTVIDIVWQHCGISTILALSTNVMNYLLTYYFYVIISCISQHQPRCVWLNILRLHYHTLMFNMQLGQPQT